jgi:glycosyltransferase involved in cell wall biosynthesis
MGIDDAPRDDVIAGVPYHRVTPDIDYVGPRDRTQTEGARATVELLETLRPAALQPASNYVQAKLALALARPMGIPVVYEVRGFWEDSWAASPWHDEATAMTTDRYLMTRETETAAMLAADAVVTLSETMRHEIIERGIPAERLTVVPNAVEIEDFEPMPRDDAIAASLGIGRGEPVVGYISSLNAYEGIEYLLEAASRLRADGQKFRVLVVGEGDHGRAIRETGSRLGLDDGTLIMPGRVPHDRIPGYYSLIDVFVVPRTGNRVSRLVTPLKPFEAMALARAVVVSDVPALREIVTPGETGMTFKADDADDLARVLSDLLGDPALRARLGRQAREWIRTERTWAQNGLRYRELYERLGVA